MPVLQKITKFNCIYIRGNRTWRWNEKRERKKQKEVVIHATTPKRTATWKLLITPR